MKRILQYFTVAAAFILIFSAMLFQWFAGNYLSFINTEEYLRTPKRSDFIYKFIYTTSKEQYQHLDSKTVYVITPTFRRPEQIAELTRLSQALRMASNIHWIVSDDAPVPSKLVLRLLNDSRLNFTYILGRALKRYGVKAKGVANRNAALVWVQKNVKSGIIYFADDDNTYDYRVFQEISYTNNVSMFPVGLVTHLGVSSPIVKKGKIIGFYDGWIGNRKFPIDMAGFAVDIRFYLERGAPFMPFRIMYEEDGFLQALQLSLSEIEPLASNCTKVLVWHTKTFRNFNPKRNVLFENDNYSNLKILFKELIFD